MADFFFHTYRSAVENDAEGDDCTMHMCAMTVLSKQLDGKADGKTQPWIFQKEIELPWGFPIM